MVVDGPKIAFVLGTRPEIIKLSPVIQECEKQNITHSIIHTGQHYDDNLDAVFFQQLKLPQPDHHLGVGSKTHGQQTAEMIAGIESILLEATPDTVLVQGDTNSVLAGAIAACKLPLNLGHVEAGLRSFDQSMPEEMNRVLTDHVANYLFAPTEQSKRNLIQENVPESKISVTGNTVVDALHRNRSLAEENSAILSTLGVEPDRYFLMTVHRAENVDNAERFENILDGVNESAKKHDVEVIYPIHPRSSARLEEKGIDVPSRIRLVEPLDYLDFLRLEAEAALILTDSGGIQEEACVVGVPCVTVRDNTERPETVAVGANEISGTDPGDIMAAVGRMLRTERGWRNPFGDGKAGQKIIRKVL